ncbi:HAD-hyrolase-like protein [uncultured archaeon]|nr:HAD-hyrolase-like protein [uncultured archaeon]
MENGAHPGSGSIGVCLAYGAGRVKKENRSSGAAFSNIVLREPDIVVGKPNTYMLDILCKGCTKSKRSSILFVGDRLDMDIAFANSAGLSSVLVLSGVTKEKEAKQARGSLKPGAILPSVAALPRWLGI